MPQPSRRVDMPSPGAFEIKLVRGGPLVACRITYDDGLWRAWIDGKLQQPEHADPAVAGGVFRIWHSGTVITEAQYRFRLATKLWAETHDRDHPSLHPTRSINLAARPAVF